MPLYEYQCDTCAHRFEVIQKYSDAPIEICPKCGAHVSKLLSSPAIQFKGSGWYVTDYGKGGSSGSGSSSSESKNESKNESKGDSKSETKTESKTETKSDSKSDAKPSGSSS
jgi:putative FmdB family regulatory protein